MSFALMLFAVAGVQQTLCSNQYAEISFLQMTPIVAIPNPYRIKEKLYDDDDMVVLVMWCC